ncbi:hypothetical protein [Anaeromonas frigoriresistens]|nr:hypothetical protein [Anaeromonas frigoriresistens]
MCKVNCEHPERRKDPNKECSPEQIKKCHGDEKEHSCCKDDK